MPPECLPDPCGGVNLNRGPNDLPFVPSAADGKCYQLGQVRWVRLDKVEIGLGLGWVGLVGFSSAGVIWVVLDWVGLGYNELGFGY